MTDGLEIRPVRGIGDITAGDDLAGLITAAAPWLADGDVLVVTSKIVSKAEGRLVEVPADGPEREAARARALAGETARVVARRGPTTIVQTHHGFVMAAAGIDASNVDKTHLVLLPVDPDASARRLRADFRARGLDVAVIVSDTMGRAWRNGLTDVALGAAGIGAFRDHRGETDPYGNELQLTQMAVIDELAAAGELVKGKCDQVPVAVVRGLGALSSSDDAGAAPLLRDAESDMFSLGTAEARAAGLRAAAALPDGHQSTLPGKPVDPAAVERALSTVADLLAPGTRVTPARTSPTHTTPPSATPPSATPTGTTPTGTTPTGTTPTGTTPTGTTPSATPTGTTPPSATPTGTTPTGLSPTGTTPTGLSPTRTPLSPTGVTPTGTTWSDTVPADMTRAGVTGTGATAALHVAAPGDSPDAFMRLGADVHRLRVALAAENVLSVARPQADGVRLDLSGT